MSQTTTFETKDQFQYKLEEIPQILNAYQVYEIENKDVFTHMKCQIYGDQQECLKLQQIGMDYCSQQDNLSECYLQQSMSYSA